MADGIIRVAAKVATTNGVKELHGSRVLQLLCLIDGGCRDTSAPTFCVAEHAVGERVGVSQPRAAQYSQRNVVAVLCSVRPRGGDERAGNRYRKTI